MNLKELAISFNYLNELKFNGKEIDPNSVEIEGVDTSQGPDDGTSGAFVSAAKFIDGQMLNDEQLDKFSRSSDPKIVDFIQSKGPDLIKIREAIKKELRNLKK